MRPNGDVADYLFVPSVGEVGRRALARASRSHCRKWTSPLLGGEPRGSSAPNVPLLPLPGQCLSSSDLTPPPSSSLPELPQTMSPSDYFPCSSGPHRLSPHQVGPCGSQSPRPYFVSPKRAVAGPTLVTADPSTSCQAHGAAISSCDQLSGFKRLRDGGSISQVEHVMPLRAWRGGGVFPILLSGNLGFLGHKASETGEASQVVLCPCGLQGVSTSRDP